MEFQQHLPFLSIFLTLMTAIIIPLFKNKNHARILTKVSMSIVILFSSILIGYLVNFSEGYFTYQLGHYSAPWGNELRAGLLEAIMALMFGVVMLLSITGGAKAIGHDIKEEKQSFYYLMLNLLMSSLLALVYTNDVFTGYVFIEINTVAACAIVLAKDSGDTVKATIKYFIMSVLGSGIYLFAIAILYSLTGHLAMSNMNASIINLAAGYDFPLMIAMVLILVGIAVKSALFPFHTWLPDAHGSATSPSSAILSGLVLKGYIILLVKIIYRAYGIERIRSLNILTIILALGLLGMIMGSVYALIQKDLKKMIAYSSVAQIGYIYLGIGLGSTIGLVAAGFHIIVHAFTKSMLFLASGSFIELTGSKEINSLTGIGLKDKVAGVAFTVGGLSMIGIPLFGGFISKLQFIGASIENDRFFLLILICLAISTLLNAMYYIPVIMKIFKKNETSKSSLELKKVEINYSLIALIVFNVLLGVLSKPLLNALEIGFRNIM